MKTQSIIIQSADAILGEAKGGIHDQGEPRLVIDASDGERVYATFTAGLYPNPASHFEAFALDAAEALSRDGRARLAASILCDLPAGMRGEVIAQVCGRYSTPRVAVLPAPSRVPWHDYEVAGAEDLAGVVSDADPGL